MRQGLRGTNGATGKIVALFVRPVRQGRRLLPQESDLKHWTVQRRSEGGPPTSFRWYRGSGAGRGASRWGWDQLVRDIEAGQISALVCWRLDRLGRTCSELVQLFELLSEHQVNLISLKTSSISRRRKGSGWRPLWPRSRFMNPSPGASGSWPVRRPRGRGGFTGAAQRKGAGSRSRANWKPWSSVFRHGACPSVISPGKPA